MGWSERAAAKWQTQRKEKNGFELHGIAHSSVSQINKMEQAFDCWFAEKVLNKTFPIGPPAHRGIVTEAIVAMILTGKYERDEALRLGLEDYDRRIGVDIDGTGERERKHIEPMVDQALEALQEFGQPVFPATGQHMIKINCDGDGWRLPIIGYLDLVYPDHGLVVDLKTTTRMPSAMSPQHIRQRCFYQRCVGNPAVRFLYVTPKKHGWLEEGDVNEELAKIKSILNRTERFLRSAPPDQLQAIVPVNPTTFYWRGAESIRNEVYT